MRFFIAFICLIILAASSAVAGPFRHRGCSSCQVQAQPAFGYAQPVFGGCVQGYPCPQATYSVPQATYGYSYAAPTIIYGTPATSCPTCPKAVTFGTGLTAPECKDGKCPLIVPKAMPAIK